MESGIGRHKGIVVRVWSEIGHINAPTPVFHRKTPKPFLGGWGCITARLSSSISNSVPVYLIWAAKEFSFSGVNLNVTPAALFPPTRHKLQFAYQFKVSFEYLLLFDWIQVFKQISWLFGLVRLHWTQHSLFGIDGLLSADSHIWLALRFLRQFAIVLFDNWSAAFGHGTQIFVAFLEFFVNLIRFWLLHGFFLLLWRVKWCLLDNSVYFVWCVLYCIVWLK